jgi:RNA polymerase sigma-70 factor (ECF subfamily)
MISLGLLLAIVVPRRPRRGGDAPQPADPDAELLARARTGEEQAFMALVARYHSTMLHLARSFVPSEAIAEEVVQDTWVAVLRGLERFEGRSTFKTWLLQILVNRARSTGVRERRSVAVGDATPAVDRSRFDGGGAWMSPPEHWVEDSDDRLLAEGLADQIKESLEALPSRQREVVMLRDIDGLSGQEVSEALDISEANQRVLLHRGRSRLRAALEAQLGGAR